MFRGNSTGNPFAVTDGKPADAGNLFTGSSANSSATQPPETGENPFAARPGSFQFRPAALATPGNSSGSIFAASSGNSSVSSTPGGFFTTPFTWEAPTAKIPSLLSKKDDGIPKDSANVGQQLFRPSIGLFGQAIGAALKSCSSKPSVASPTNNEIQSLQSLYVSDLPDELLNKTLLTKHFSQFGQVTKIHFSVKHRSCTLNYENHEGAERAKSHGANLRNIPLTIFWAKPASSQRLSSSLADSATQSPSTPIKESTSGVETDAMRKVRSKSMLERSDPKSYALADDVQDELNAMINKDALTSISESKTTTSRPTRKIRPRTAKPAMTSSKSVTSLKLKERATSSSRDSFSQLRTPKSTAVVETEPLYGATQSMDELKKILRMPAHTSEERYRVLEARDKLMRMKRVRESDLSKARINRGSCPDMCPEKERYHREYQRQVAVYEQSVTASGKIDHAKAVKQYSRSSADQEEPLSHELRPAPVLRLTMDYLMWKLLDICNNKDENMADWYHYIWDRTRGIRKDITQQELCDENTVTLVEQCARWHIVCSERLIAEDLMVYDDNINTENLTKCLQTLKYMYQDLWLKGIACPNEAEFRAYFVLLNLSEGDCMWEVQQLRSEIRESEPVHFALQVAAALSSNNYVRFFKLVRATTYLNACILHRYFAQVRSRALHNIVRAYCARTNTAVFTLEEIVRLCGLGTAEEAAILCQHYGLNLTEDRTSVIFSRHTYSRPETALPAYRVLSLVEAKRHCSIGETVSGGTEPSVSYESHIPHDSFDSKGVLKLSAWMATDQGGERCPDDVEKNQTDITLIEDVQAVIDEESLRREAALKRKQEMEIIKLCNEVVDEVVHDECCTIVERSMKDALVDAAAVDIFEETLATVTEEMTREIWNKVMSEAIINEREQLRLAQIAAEAEMLEKMRQKKFQQELNRYLDEFMMECCQKVIQDELALEQLQIKLTEGVIEDCIKEECKKIVDKCVAEARSAELERIRARYERRQLKYYFRKWLKYTRKSKYRQQCMFQFPAWLSKLSLDEQVSSLDQPDPLLIEHMSRYRFAAYKSKLLALERELPAIPRLDVARVVQHPLSTRMKELSCFDAYLFWKVLVSIPDSQEAPQHTNAIKRWTDAVFSISESQPVLCSQVKPSSYETVTICVRSIIGDSQASYACQGINGILLWISHKDKSLATAKQRLRTLLTAKPKHPAIPVAIVLSGPMSISNKQIYRELDLVSLREASFVSYYKAFLMTANTGKELTSQLDIACRWLAELAPLPSPLVVMSMRHLLNRCLADEFWGQVRAASQVGLQDPNDFIKCYNSVLEKLRDMLFNESLEEYSSGATEFRKYLADDIVQEQRRYHVAPDYWNGSAYYHCVEKVLSNAQLPLIKPWPPADHAGLKDTMVAYCKFRGLSHIMSNIYHVIQQHTRMQYQSDSSGFDPSDWDSFLKMMPWSFVVQMIVEAKLEALPCDGPIGDHPHELQVVVNRENLAQLELSEWWLTEISLHNISGSSVETVAEREEKGGNKRSIADETPLPSKQRKLSLVEVYSNIKSACSKIDETMNAVKATWAKIDSEGSKPVMS